MSVAPNFNRALIHREPSFKRACSIIFGSKEEARQVLDLLFSLVNRTGFVTVYDLYLFIGIDTITEDDLIGWTDLSGAVIKPTWDRKEYNLILPRLNADHRVNNIQDF